MKERQDYTGLNTERIPDGENVIKGAVQGRGVQGREAIQSGSYQISFQRLVIQFLPCFELVSVGDLEIGLWAGQWLN